MTCPADGYYLATLEYGFFPGYARKPTEQEIHELIPLSKKFFTRTLQSTYTIIRSVKVTLELMGWHYDDNATKEKCP